ncbi:MAG: hypothetical protein NOOUEUKL_002447 [Candidatus Fervidibacter sp.]
MVETGRNVVGLAGGSEKAPSVLAALRAGLLSRLVTDDRCAATLLELTVPRWRMADVPSRPQWWEASQRFFAAHLRYRCQPRLSVSAIANRLRLSPKTVRRLLEEARQGKGKQPPMVRLTVQASEAMALDAVFIGIGVFAPTETLYLYAQEVGLPVKELAGKVAGSTLFQGISADGQIMPLGFEGRGKALPLERLQRLVQEGKPVIVLASGDHKAPAILAAHRAKLFNGLVVDRNLAAALLRASALPTFNEAPSSA